MDERTKHACEGCMHGFCGGGHGALRWVIGIIIFIMIFWMGVRVGEIKSEMYGGYGGYGQRMMYDRGYYYGPSMMYGYPTQQTAPVVVPSTKSTK